MRMDSQSILSIINYASSNPESNEIHFPAVKTKNKARIRAIAQVKEKIIGMGIPDNFLDGVRCFLHEYGHLADAYLGNLCEIIPSFEENKDRTISLSKKEMDALIECIYKAHHTPDVKVIISVGKKIITALVPKEKRFRFFIQVMSDEELFTLSLRNVSLIRTDDGKKTQLPVHDKQRVRLEVVAMYTEMIAMHILENTLRQKRIISWRSEIILDNTDGVPVYMRARKLAFRLYSSNKKIQNSGFLNNYRT